MKKRYSSFKYSIFEKQLDDWLGIDRNGEKGLSVITDYNDERICKYSLAGCCPYSLLQNIRLARHPCRAEVCPAPQPLKEAYQRDKTNITHPFDQQLYDLLDQILTSADKKIHFSKSLRDSKASELQVCPQLVQMDSTIQNLLNECRKCGIENHVSRACGLLDRVNLVKEQRTAAKQELMNAMEQKSKVVVCEVCTAVIKQSDMEGRMAEHSIGRQHVAYLRMREVFETLKSAGIVSNRTKGKKSWKTTPFSSMARKLQELDSWPAVV
jgi:hypothetical protein